MKQGNDVLVLLVDVEGDTTLDFLLRMAAMNTSMP